MNAETPCAEEGCDRSAAQGYALYRVNPKGEKGIFKCSEHAGKSDPVVEAIAKKHC